MRKKTLPLTTRLHKAVRRLVAAKVNRSWKGYREACEYPHIEQEYQKARKAYRKVLKELMDTLKEKKP